MECLKQWIETRCRSGATNGRRNSILKPDCPSCRKELKVNEVKKKVDNEIETEKEDIYEDQDDFGR